MRKSFAVKTFVVLTLVATLLAGCQNTGAKKEESEQEAKSINVSVENPLDRKDIQPVHSKGDQPWVFFGRNDAKAETPVLWLRHVKS